MPLPFRRPHHVLRPRDRCRTITPLLLFGVLPEPVHATRSDAETSTIMHLARVPGKELPQEVPFNPVPVCPPPALVDLHDAHSHPGFTRRQHSAHVEDPPVPCDAFVLQQIVHALLRSHHPIVRVPFRPRSLRRAWRSRLINTEAAAGSQAGFLGLGKPGRPTLRREIGCRPLGHPRNDRRHFPDAIKVIKSIVYS
jgi:hypothetical protein